MWKRTRSRPVVLGLVAAAALVGACGGDGSKIFGEQTEPCAPTVLTNDPDDADELRWGSDCLLAEIDAGRPVVWDVLAVTVEGDPIPTRYEFDGDTVTITRDSTRDEFGAGSVTAERCDTIRPGRGLPEGVNCVGSAGDGFRSDSLPTG